MTWTLVKGHKGRVKGLSASGPQGPDPLFTHTHVTVNSEELIGTTEYLTLWTGCRINRCH
jgi:hypothetical protein